MADEVKNLCTKMMFILQIFMYSQDRSLTEDEKKARKKADRERKRQEARDAAEKKKRFGLTPEKKRKLRVCY